MTKEVGKDDVIFSNGSAKVVIDKLFLNFFNNSTLEYIENLSSASFVIQNSNISSSCGCGVSFSLH